MLTLARRAVADTIRREQRSWRSVPTADPPEQVTPGPAGRIALDELVAALPEPLRQAFALTQILGLTYEQATGVADTRIGTIRSRVHRAREQLLAALDEGRRRHA